jgi:hypothetical protein
MSFDGRAPRRKRTLHADEVAASVAAHAIFTKAQLAFSSPIDAFGRTVTNINILVPVLFRSVALSDGQSLNEPKGTTPVHNYCGKRAYPRGPRGWPPRKLAHNRKK